jgi:hypothetical protein
MRVDLRRLQYSDVPDRSLSPAQNGGASVLERLIGAGQRLVTIERRDAIRPALQVTLEMVDEVIPMEKADVLRAAEITQSPALMSARDAVAGPAVMKTCCLRVHEPSATR